MKKLLSVLAIFGLICTLSVAVTGCKETPKPAPAADKKAEEKKADPKKAEEKKADEKKAEEKKAEEKKS